MKTGRILRATRIVVSLAVMAATTMALTAGEAALAAWLGWTGAIQIVPLVMAGSLTGIGLWMSVTLVFGRIYCSSACPLGTLMDVFTWLRRKLHPQSVFRYAAPLTGVRVGELAVMAAALVVGIVTISTILDPYATFARILGPVLSQKALILLAGRVITAMWGSALVAVITLVFVAALSYRRGRLLCNSLCPVGTALGGLSRFAMLQMEIDTDTCTHCRRCEYACKAQCIDLSSHTVDSSRCVVCFDCIDACPDGSIRWTTSRKRLSTPLIQRVASASAMTENPEKNSAPACVPTAAPAKPADESLSQTTDNLTDDATIS